MTENLQMKLTLLVFTLLIALAFTGAASASLVPTEEMLSTGPIVVETGTMFNGPTAIQDAIDHVYTENGQHIQVETGYYYENIVVSKDLTITGNSQNPADTVIESASAEGTVIVPEGVNVVLENMSILNVNVYPIVNNGQLTLINCMVNNDYYANEVMVIQGGAAGDSPESTGTTTETMTTSALPGTSFESSTPDSNPETEPTTGTGTDTTSTDESEDTTGTSDPGIPLASLASGMLMVMGGTVVSKKHH